MQEMIPNTSDGAVEKHVPVIEKTAHGSGYSVKVKVGAAVHPMLEEHYIPLIAAVSGDTIVLKFPKAGDTPELNTFSRSEQVTAYELCNLHGYWKSAD